MKKVVENLKGKLVIAKAAIVSFFFLAVSNAHAALPETADPSNAAADGDYIGLIKGYAYDALIVGGLLIGAFAFYRVAINAVSVYAEIGAGKKQWGDLGMHGLMGVLLLVFVVYLLTEASTIIF